MQVTVYPNNEVRVHGVPWPSAPRRSDRERPRRRFKLPDPSAPLDIGSKASQASGGKGSRRYPMSKAARHKILKYGGLFRKPRKCLQCFVTGTLPGSTKGAMTALARGSGRFMKILQTYVLREMGQPSDEVKYLWVYELQARGALHVHAVFEWKTKKIARRFLGKWASIWAKALRAFDSGIREDLFGRKKGGSWRNRPDVWQTDAEFVRKDAAAYLSKYVGKQKRGNSEYYPSRWFGASTGLRRSMTDWLEVNVFREDIELVPGLTRDAVVAHLEACLKEEFVGNFKEVHDRSNASSIAFFGYRKPSTSAMKICRIVFDELRRFSVQRRINPLGEALKVKAMDYIDWTLSDLRIRTSRPFYYRFIAELPPATKKKFLEGGPIGRNEVLDISATMDSVIQKFYRASEEKPPWVAPCRGRLAWLLDKYEW